MSTKDPRYIKMINSTRWRTLRSWKLKQNPFCEECLKEGIYTPSTCVHHIEPVEDCHTLRDMEERMYNSSNLSSLCRDCHHAIHNAEGYHKKEQVKERQKERVNRIIKVFFGE